MITLNDGTSVRVSGVRMGTPYGGMLEGLPTKAQNDKIIERAKTSFTKDWGTRQVHLVGPKRSEPKIMGHDSVPDRLKDLYPDPERLPDCLFQVWLDSWTTYDKADDGTEVVLVFFVDKTAAINKTLKELVTEASVSFKWKDVAKGFGY